jgi:hypothetical protein
VRGPLRRLILSALLVAAAYPSRAARAQDDEPTVSVSVDPCVPIDRAALQRILTVELGTSTIQHDAALAAKAPTRVHIGCSESGVLLRLEDGVTSKVMTRALPAQSFVDPSSTRLLALAVAEFVVASWVELQVQPEPAIKPLPVAPAPSPGALREVSAKVKALPGPDPPDRTVLSLGASFQLYAEQGSPWLGASARVLGTVGRSFAWSVSGDVGGSGSEVSIGSVSTLAGLFSVAALLHARLGDVALYTGPAARAGFARIAGTSDDATRARGLDFFAPFGGPAWLVRVELSPSRVLRLGVDAELGYVTLPAQATFAGRDVYAIDGLWGTTALWAGVGF